MQQLFIIAIGAGILNLAGCTGAPRANKTSPSGDLPFTITTIHIGKSLNSVESADFNDDGNPDLAIANDEDSSISILLNTGKGDFAPAPGSPFFCNQHPNDIAIADFNKDGKPDLAIANTEISELTLLLGNGKGQFTQAPHSPYKVYSRPHTHGVAVADFNGDGRLDMATDDWAENKVSVIFGDSTLNFGHQTFYPVGKHPYQRLRTADVDQDGRPDLITTNLDGNNSTVLLGNAPAGANSATSPSGTNSVFPATFRQAPGSPFPCGDAPFAVAIGDINGDGHPDLIITDAPTITSESKGRDGLYILLGDGTGRFRPLQDSPFATGKSPSRLAIGDLNGDGINDIAVTNYNDRTITIFYMNKTGVAGKTTIQAGNHPDGICIRDFNKDGKNDLAVTNQEDGTVMILLNK
ncbi:MAG TPA: VCBS repeat-containing protein [Puia sp.]|jgi:hypothetical protein|nr:VCBS repeat-containing protein [Puia sp.]